MFSDSELMLKVVTGLFVIGAVHALIARNYLLAGYYACAAGLQIFVLLMANK